MTPPGWASSFKQFHSLLRKVTHSECLNCMASNVCNNWNVKNFAFGGVSILFEGLGGAPAGVGMMFANACLNPKP